MIWLVFLLFIILVLLVLLYFQYRPTPPDYELANIDEDADLDEYELESNDSD